MKRINIEKTYENLISWIQDWFEINGPTSKAVIGISGGKDSTVVAYLCTKALGKDRVIGVLMPNGEQADIQDSKDVVEALGIEYHIMNIENAYLGVYKEVESKLNMELSRQTQVNLAPRLRTAFLYAVAQSVNGRVTNNSNASEKYVGYSTRWGDDVGDVSILSHLTKSEVVAIGQYMGVPSHLIDKHPSDGLTGKTDEDNFGFTYAELDEVIRGKECTNERIKQMHENSSFKRVPIPAFDGLVWE